LVEAVDEVLERGVHFNPFVRESIIEMRRVTGYDRARTLPSYARHAPEAVQRTIR
jgi:hypothetical protein